VCVFVCNVFVCNVCVCSCVMCVCVRRCGPLADADAVWMPIHRPGPAIQELAVQDQVLEVGIKVRGCASCGFCCDFFCVFECFRSVFVVCVYSCVVCSVCMYLVHMCVVFCAYW